MSAQFLKLKTGKRIGIPFYSERMYKQSLLDTYMEY